MSNYMPSSRCGKPDSLSNTSKLPRGGLYSSRAISTRSSKVRSPAPVKPRQEDHLYSKQLQNCDAFIPLSCRDFTGAGDRSIVCRVISEEPRSLWKAAVGTRIGENSTLHGDKVYHTFLYLCTQEERLRIAF